MSFNLVYFVFTLISVVDMEPGFKLQGFGNKPHTRIPIIMVLQPQVEFLHLTLFTVPLTYVSKPLIMEQ